MRDQRGWLRVISSMNASAGADGAVAACQDLRVALQSLTADDPAEVGPYGLRGRLGAGGMGIVYLGFDSTGNAVAVKTLAPGVGPHLRRRLRRESELLAGIRHPRVAQFVDADIAADRPWIAMHYIPGPSLADAPVPLADPPLRQLADGLAEALAALHRGGLTHRDVKPGNVILTFDGPVLVDLGIAASADATSFTAHGTVVGTPAWMAPEQLAGGAVGPPADVWGWAAVVAYAATGQPPFGDGPVPAVAYRIQHVEPGLSGLPGWLRDSVAAGLSKDPARRPTAGELVSGRTMSMRPEAPTAPFTLADRARAAAGARTEHATRTDPSQDHRRWRPAALAALGVLAAAGVAAAVVVGLHNHNNATATPPTKSTTTTTTPSTVHSSAASTSTSTAPDTSHVSGSPTVAVNTQLLRALGVCSAQCVITGRVAIQHPVWGDSRLITTAPTTNGTMLGTAHIAVIDAAGQLKWSYALPGMYSLAPAPKPVDATGHVFLNYNPGRYNGVIVLDAIGGGFDDFDSLPKQDNSAGGRFYSATTKDVDGTYEIDVATNNCVPDCADGKLEHTIYQWTGTAYAAI